VRNYKKMLLTGAMLAFFGLTGGVQALAADDIQLIINNQLYTPAELDAAPQLKGDRTYVPLRLIGESLGNEVNWVEHKRWVVINEPGGQASIYDDGIRVADDAPISIYINGKEIPNDAFTGMPFITETGRTMVPIRLVGENLNCNVHWQEGLVVVDEKKPEPPVVSGDQSDDEEEALASVWHGLSIQGESIATARELKAFLAEKEPVIREMMETRYPDLGFTPFPEDIVDLYLEIGARYNIRGDLAFAQALKETGYFQFYGIVKPFQNNFCGLGATGDENTGEEPLNGVDPDRAMYIPGLHGIMFMSVADGVEAHIQHLYAYTTDKKLPAGCELVDPRFNYVKRGVAERWIDLNGRWAVPGNGYGESMIDDYWMPAVKDRLQELE
jgi:hypothetical protein